MSDGLDRRELLKRLGAAAAWGSGLLGWIGCARPAALEEALPACVRDQSAARVVGEAVLLASGPHHPSVSQLLDRLAGEERATWEELAAAGSDALIERIHARHRADFEAGRLRRVRGWMLSETEANLCALVARRAAGQAAAGAGPDV